MSNSETMTEPHVRSAQGQIRIFVDKILNEPPEMRSRIAASLRKAAQVAVELDPMRAEGWYDAADVIEFGHSKPGGGIGCCR